MGIRWLVLLRWINMWLMYPSNSWFKKKKQSLVVEFVTSLCSEPIWHRQMCTTLWKLSITFQFFQNHVQLPGIRTPCNLIMIIDVLYAVHKNYQNLTVTKNSFVLLHFVSMNEAKTFSFSRSERWSTKQRTPVRQAKCDHFSHDALIPYHVTEKKWKNWTA